MPYNAFIKNLKTGTDITKHIWVIRAAVIPLPEPNLKTNGRINERINNRNVIILVIPRRLKSNSNAGSVLLKMCTDERHVRIIKVKLSIVINIDEKYRAYTMVDLLIGRLAYIISALDAVSTPIKINEEAIHRAIVIKVKTPMINPPKSSIIAHIAIVVIKGIKIAMPSRKIQPAIKSFFIRLSMVVPQIAVIHDVLEARPVDDDVRSELLPCLADIIG